MAQNRHNCEVKKPHPKRRGQHKNLITLFDQLTEAIKRNYRIQILLKSTLESLKMNKLYNWNLYLFSNSQENERTTLKTKRLIILSLVYGDEFIRGYQSPDL